MSETVTFKSLTYTNSTPWKLTEKSFDLKKDLKSDEIIVKVNSAALNPVDLILYHSARYMFLKRNEKGVGRDFSGTVYATGSAVKNYVKGDKVAGIYLPIYGTQGTITEYLKFKPATEATMGKVPENLTLSEASSYPLVFGTAWNALNKYHVPGPESRVLVLGGATSVGHYVIQLLKNHYGTKTVVSVNSGASAELVASLGADTVIDYTKGQVAKTALDLVQNDYKGEKFDLIVDCVGNNDLFPIINDILKPKTEKAGYVTLVGDSIADYNLSAFNFINFGTFKKLIPFLRSYNYGFAAPLGDFLPLAKKLFEEGKLKTTIDSEYPFSQYEEAYKKLSTHKAKGKIIINIE